MLQRAYGTISAAVLADGRKPRGGRAIDLLIAAVALSERLPLYTRNPADFSSLACTTAGRSKRRLDAGLKRRL
jgi:predicted nucleic acid-binding protein